MISGSFIIGLFILFIPTFIFHEAGHIIVSLLLGYKIKKINLTKIQIEPHPENTTHILLIATAGIVLGFVPLLILFPNWLFIIAYISGCGWDLIMMYNAVFKKEVYKEKFVNNG